MTEMPLTPWRYAGGGQVYGRDGRQIAYVAARMQAYDDTAIGNTIAKAWLIPELAEALRAVLDDYEGGLRFSANTNPDGPCSDVDFQEEFPDSFEVCQSARAVLAKLDTQP